MIQFRRASLDDLELLVGIRLHDLQMFSNQPIQTQIIQNIRQFYQEKLSQHSCETILGYDQEYLIASASLYQYQVLPSHQNPTGYVGQLTNVWVHDDYRHQGLATQMIDYFISRYKGKVGMICLNASHDGMQLYQKLGFIKKENYFVMHLE